MKFKGFRESHFLRNRAMSAFTKDGAWRQPQNKQILRMLSSLARQGQQKKVRLCFMPSKSMPFRRLKKGKCYCVEETRRYIS